MEARLAAAESRLHRRHVKAASGFRTGEIVPQGRPPENLTVRFAGETFLQKLAVGDTVIAHCDHCEAPVNASIRFISPTVEFTPLIIYTNEERSRRVFMVEALPELPQNLRPVQPITVSLPSAAVSDDPRR